MKFLCVPCDRPMKLQTVAPPDRGSLSVVYTCPDCGYEIAMLTNPYETQLVQSLGVRVGPGEAAAGVGATQATGQIAGAAAADGPKCPFAAMMPTVEGDVARAGSSGSAGANAWSAVAGAEPQAESRIGLPETLPIRWTSAAEARLANIPAFVRPMARTGIEKYAREQGCVEIDEKILDAARDFFGM